MLGLRLLTFYLFRGIIKRACTPDGYGVRAVRKFAVRRAFCKALWKPAWYGNGFLLLQWLVNRVKRRSYMCFRKITMAAIKRGDARIQSKEPVRRSIQILKDI